MRCRRIEKAGDGLFEGEGRPPSDGLVWRRARLCGNPDTVLCASGFGWQRSDRRREARSGLGSFGVRRRVVHRPAELSKSDTPRERSVELATLLPGADIEEGALRR